MLAWPVAMQQLFVALVRSRPRRLRNGNETTRTLARPGRSHSMGVAGRRLGPQTNRRPRGWVPLPPPSPGGFEPIVATYILEHTPVWVSTRIASPERHKKFHALNTRRRGACTCWLMPSYRDERQQTERGDLDRRRAPVERDASANIGGRRRRAAVAHERVFDAGLAVDARSCEPHAERARHRRLGPAGGGRAVAPRIARNREPGLAGRSVRRDGGGRDQPEC